MKYWLLKSESETFSIDDLEKVKVEPWTGVRNYQARNILRDDMQVGDLCFFYRSSCKVPAIVGLCEVVKAGYVEVDKWFCVDVKFVEKFKKEITLEEIKKIKSLEKMKLLQKGSRLSVQAVTSQEFATIAKIVE